MMRLNEKSVLLRLTLHCVNMSFKQGRNCPICFKENLHYLGDYLRQVHQLSGAEKKNWLKSGVFSTTKSTGLPCMLPFPFWGMPQYPMGLNPQFTDRPILAQSTKPKPRKVANIEPTQCLETTVYPDYKFNHMFSMLVVGPSQCGKNRLCGTTPNEELYQVSEQETETYLLVLQSIAASLYNLEFSTR